MKAASGQRTECATIVAQYKHPQGRATLGEVTPKTSRPEGATKTLHLPTLMGSILFYTCWY